VPLIAHHDAPEMMRAAATLFGAGSPWVPLTAKRAGYDLVELLGTDLVHVPALRDHALAELANHAKHGTMRMMRGGLDVRTESYQQGEGVDPTDKLLPKDGWTATLRVADEYANNLSHNPSAPRFRRYWPLAERDHVIAEIAAWLKTQ
jgi:hypothetical protein